MHDGSAHKELPIDDHVEKDASQHSTNLVVSELDELAKLLLALAIHLFSHFVLRLVIVTCWTAAIILIVCAQ